IQLDQSVRSRNGPRPKKKLTLRAPIAKGATGSASPRGARKLLVPDAPLLIDAGFEKMWNLMQVVPPHTISTEAQQPASIGIYIHFPWCLAKCPYCDFLSLAEPHPERIPDDDYTAAVI